jgi:hypothetical protein
MELIDLKGPQVVSQPAQAYAMQEGRVIMPEPQVAIGKGFDWDSFGKSFAELGTQVVQAVHEKDNADKENLLQKLSIDTDSMVSEALDNGDYAAWQTAVDDYKKGATRITGYDFDAVPAGKLPQQLMEQTRSNFYKWSDQKTGSERDAKFSAMSDKIEKLSTEMGIRISAAFENGRFDEADTLTREFQEKVSTILGVSFNEDKPVGKIRASILSRAKNDITKWIASKGVAQQKYQGAVELSSLDTIAARFEKDVSQDIDSTTRLSLEAEYKGALEKIHQDQLGVSMFADIDPKKNPLTEQQMAVRSRLQHHWLRSMDVVSAAERANNKTGKMEEVGNLAQNRVANAGRFLKAAKNANERANALRAEGNIAEADQADAEAVSFARKGNEHFNSAVMLYGSTIDKQIDGANKPMEVIDWTSDDGLMILENVVPKTVYDNLIRYREAEDELNTTNLKGAIAIHKSLRDKTKKAQIGFIDQHIGETKSLIERFEGQLKDPKNNQLRYAYQRAAQQHFEALKGKLLGELYKLDSSGYFAKLFASQSKVITTPDILRDPILALFPPGLASQRYMEIARNSPKFDLETMRAYVPLVSVEDQEVWTHVVNQLEQVQSKLNTMGGSSTGKKQVDYVRMLNQERNNEFVPWSGDDVTNTVVEAFAMAGVNLVDNNGNVLGWNDIAPQLANMKSNSYIPWRLMTQSPVFQSFMVEAMNNPDPMWAEKNLGQLMKGPEESGRTWLDIENDARHRADLPANPNLGAIQEMITDKWRSRETPLVSMSLLLPKQDRDALSKFVSLHNPRTNDPVEHSQWLAFQSFYTTVLDEYDSDLRKISQQADKTTNVFDHVRSKPLVVLNSESKTQLDNYRADAAGTLNDDTTYIGARNNTMMSQEKKAAFVLHKDVRSISSRLTIDGVRVDSVFSVAGMATYPENRKIIDGMIANELLLYRQNPSADGNEAELVSQRVQEQLNKLTFDHKRTTFKGKAVSDSLVIQTVPLPIHLASETGIGGAMDTEDLILLAPGNFSALSQVPHADQAIYDNLRKDYGDVVAFAVASSNVGRLQAGNKVDNTLKAASILKDILPTDASPVHIMAAQAALATTRFGIDPSKHSSEIAIEYNRHLSQIRKRNGITVEERGMRNMPGNALPTLIYRNDRGMEIASFQPTQDTLSKDLSDSSFYKDKVSKMDFDTLDETYWRIPATDVKSRQNLIVTWMKSHPGQEVVMPRAKLKYSWFYDAYSFENGEEVIFKYSWKQHPNGRRYIYKSPMMSAVNSDKIVDAGNWYTEEQYQGRQIYLEPVDTQRAFQKQVSGAESITVDNLSFSFEQKATIKSIYERLYGKEGAKKRLEQAIENQKTGNSLVTLPDYSSTSEVPMYRYSGSGDLVGVTALFEKNKDGESKILLSKSADDTSKIHEMTHSTQPKLTSGLSLLFTQEEVDKMTKEEFYVLSKTEIPAWVAQLKAQYYLETKNELLPNSSAEDYDKFIGWMKKQGADKKSGVFINALHGLLTTEGKRKSEALKTLRQVAMANSPNTFA